MADHYATVADVNGYSSQVPFTASSKPNEATVTAMIEDTANDMDSVLGNLGYVTPITGAHALAWCRRTCLFGALGVAQASRGTGVNTAVSASGREVKNIWLQMYDARMAALASGSAPDELSDAPRTNEQLLKQPEQVLRSFIDGVTDDVDYDPNAPVVTRYQTL